MSAPSSVPAIDLYHKIVGLPQEVLNQLEIPIDRWMKSKTQQGYVDKMIDLGIAFESFFPAWHKPRSDLPVQPPGFPVSGRRPRGEKSIKERT